MANFFVLGDFGLPITVEVVDKSDNFLDISAATTVNIVLKKPDGSILTKTAAFVTDGTDGKITYVVESGVLSVTGQWTARAQVIITPTVDYKTKQGDFKVLE